MTVEQFIRMLRRLPPDCPVVIQRRSRLWRPAAVVYSLRDRTVEIV